MLSFTPHILPWYCLFLFSVLPRCICTPPFTAILPPSPISSPHLFSLTARLSLVLFTSPLLTVLTSSYFSPLGFFPKHVYFPLWECSIAMQLQVSAKQILFLLPLHAWSALEAIEVLLPQSCIYTHLFLPCLQTSHFTYLHIFPCVVCFFIF